MTEQFNRGRETLLTALEDELLTSTDDDIRAGPGADAIVRRMQAIVDAQVRPGVQRQGLSVHAVPRRDRRGRAPNHRRDTKRQMVDRVLVANPVARSLATPESVAIMDENELDHLLVRLRTLGVSIEDDEKLGPPRGA